MIKKVTFKCDNKGKGKSVKKTREPETFMVDYTFYYHNFPKFSDRQVWANSVDPGLIRVYTVCHSVCIVWTHYSILEPHSSNFRMITTNFLGAQIFRKFTVSVPAS